MNFSCPRAPLEFTQINFSCPPKIYFSAPSHAILAPGLAWAEGLRIQTVGEDLFYWSSPNFGPKTGLKLSEDLSVFWSSPDFRQEKQTDCGGKNLILNFLDLRFSESPGNSFRKSCIRYWLPPAICLRMVYHLKVGNSLKGFSLRHNN